MTLIWWQLSDRLLPKAFRSNVDWCN